MSLSPAQKVVVFTVICMSIGTLSAIDMYLASLPSIGDYFTTDEVTIKLAIPLFLCGSLLSAFVIGFLSDHWGRKPVCLAGLGVFFLGSILSATASWLPVFLIGRFLQGVGAACSPVLGWAMLNDTLPKGNQSTKILSMIGSIASLAPLVSPALGGFMHQFFGWRGSFCLMSVIAVSLFSFLLLKVPETLSLRHKGRVSFKSFVSNYGLIARNPLFFAYVSFFALAIVGEWCFLTMSPFYFEDVLHVPSHYFGLFVGGVALLYCVALGLLSKITARWGDDVPLKAAPFCAIAGTGLFFVAYFFAPMNPYLITVAVSIFMMGAAFGWFISVTKSLDLFPNNKGVASSVRGLSVMGSMALGGWIGRLIPSDSLAPVGLCLLTCTLLMTIISVYLHRRTVQENPLSDGMRNAA